MLEKLALASVLGLVAAGAQADMVGGGDDSLAGIVKGATVRFDKDADDSGKGIAIKGDDDDGGGKVPSSTGSGTPDPVPEPQTIALVLAGLGMLGAFARRRRDC